MLLLNTGAARRPFTTGPFGWMSGDQDTGVRAVSTQ